MTLRDPIFPDLGLIGRVGFGAFLLALVLAPWLGGYPAGAAYGADMPLTAIRALVIVAALCLSFGGPAPQRWRPAGIALWCAFALTLLSLLVHSHFLASPVLLFAMLPSTLDWLCYALAFSLCLRFGGNPRALVWIVGAFALGAGGTSFIGAREYGGYVQDHMPEQRLSGTFFDPNFAAGYLALVLPIIVAWCLAARERLGALVLGVLSALTFAALVGTGSRAGIGIGLVGLLVALVAAVVSARGTPLVWGRVAALLVACAVVGFGFRGPLTHRAASGGAGAVQEHSGQFRVWTWKGTLAMATANPILGTGPGTFPFRYPPFALVQKSELAHESYLQLAAEQGFPALLGIIVTLAFTASTAVAGLLRRKISDNTTCLLLCGLIGALLVGAARSVFDSEWSIAGNALPFWAVVGLIAGIAAGPATAPPQRPIVRTAGALGLGAAFITTLLLLRAVEVRDTAQAQRLAHQQVENVSVWPPDPDLAYWSGHPEEAARIEPSTKRFYQWGRVLADAGRTAEAAAAFDRAVAQDPNNFQARRALAEAQEKSGDAAGALITWRELIRRYEGPPGTIRAIPEMTERDPPYAYAALARAEKQEGDTAAAVRDYEKSAAMIEAYTRTDPLYQRMEIASAQISGVPVLRRRADLRYLYERVIEEWTALTPSASQKAALSRRRDETLARLDTMMKPEPLPQTQASPTP